MTEPTPPPSLFVTDDNAPFREVVRRVAEPMGWRVVECANGRELRALLEAGEEPDLVFLDVLMPEADGVEAVQYLAERGCRAQVVFISGGEPTLTEAAAALATLRGLEVRTSLRKPVNVETLRGLLARDAA